MAVEKAVKDAKKKLMRIPLVARTVPHTIKGYYGSTRVFLAPAAAGTGVTAVAFDRAGYRYHGRVKALADAAREAGLKF